VAPDTGHLSLNPEQLKAIPKVQSPLFLVGEVQMKPILGGEQSVRQGIVQFSYGLDKPLEPEESFSVHALEIEKAQLRSV
jgi:hypothetical protein